MNRPLSRHYTMDEVMDAVIGWTGIIGALALLFLAGCGDTAPRGGISATSTSLPTVKEDSAYSIGGYNVVREFRLRDGTRCVVANANALACDWQGTKR